MDGPNRRRTAVTGDLPEDSLAEILARVPVKSLCRSKCVAKGWRDLIEDPFHRKKLPQTLQGFFFISRQDCGLHIDYASLLTRPAASLQIDTSPSFLTKMPGYEYETLTFADSCNGLLCFERKQKSSPLFDYVVWNPATKEWGEVPRCGALLSCMDDIEEQYTFLVFDPAISSSHFHLVQFLFLYKLEGDDGEGSGDDGLDDEDEGFYSSMHVYSSETGQWVKMVSNGPGLEIGGHDDRLMPCHRSWSALLNGMLHFIITDQNEIIAVDVQGVTRKIMAVPMMMAENISAERYNVAQSQGRLHYIKQAADAQLLVWVLQDYDTQGWVLKHSVSFMELFGKRRPCRGGRKNSYCVVGMHPDGNVVFIVQNWNLKLISYDMDHKLVSVIRTLEKDTPFMDVVPYVPCFSELPALTNKH